MKKILFPLMLMFGCFFGPAKSHATEITGKVSLENPMVITVVDFKGRMFPTHVNHLDSTFHIKLDIENPEIMTFFLTYKDETGEKRQIYSPILVKEGNAVIKIDIKETNGLPMMTSEDPNQSVFLDFTDFLVENLRGKSGNDEKNLPEKIKIKIDELKSLAENPLVVDYLDLWGESSVHSTEMLIHLRSDLDKETKRRTMPRYKIEAEDLINNKATKYFPEFVNVVAKKYGDGHLLTDKIFNLQQNLPKGELLDYITTRLIVEYINANKTKIETEELISQVTTVGSGYPEYESWLNTIKGYKSYLNRGDEAPDDILLGVDGQEYRISDFKGKYLFIDFWASWCTYCIKEFPALEKIKDEFEGSEIQFIGISLDEESDNWKKALSKYNLDQSQYLVSSNELAEKLGLQAIPRYIIYDKEGKMLYPDAPRPRDTEKLIELLKSLS